MTFGSAAVDGFIRTRGICFLLNGNPYYANGFNAYWLMFVASDPSERSNVLAAFRDAATHALMVARTGAFSEWLYTFTVCTRLFLTDITALLGSVTKMIRPIRYWHGNEPRCTLDSSGRIVQKPLGGKAGLEGFYVQSTPQQKKLNPSLDIGTDFIANNLIPAMDFATVHSFPDQWDGFEIVLSESSSTANIIARQARPNP
ncbi:mannan endo-1,4-beta-mannosidase 7-like [Hibiscus syriacus]|uniref:mannan endo-1,4-beta-mannosidase 7-like n=1 Tax=Hibiscus syriacus TaxID=106335 RepID=UPI001921C624|nr:mannan endo-1,4-beta-mannosidase 7-like [Hibiscus syriacus]